MNTSTRVLPSLVQCCARCSALVDNTSSWIYAETEICATAAQGCRVCTLLLRQAGYDGRSGDDTYIDIVRQGASLRDEATGVRLLRLCRDTGQSTPTLQDRNDTDAYIQHSKPGSSLGPHSPWSANPTKS
jgi:hypothetical protein